MGCLKLKYHQNTEPKLVWNKKTLTSKKSDLKRRSYFLFGLKHKGYNNVVSSNGNSTAQKIKFNGKELQNELGLNLYHYGARFYDPTIGQFTTIDPKAESYASQGGYVYAANNPIAFHEKNGENPVLAILRALAKKGVKYAAKNAKGQLKPVTRKHAQKLLKNKKSVFKTTDGSSIRKAKKVYKSANPKKKIVKHEGHALKNKQGVETGKKGLDHFQKASGDGSHIFYDKANSAGTIGAVTVASSETSANTSDSNSENNNSSNSTGDFDTLVSSLKKATTLPGQPDTEQAANLGKTIIGDNKVGRFIDNWINPFGLVDDVKGLIIIKILSTKSDNEN